MQHIERGAEPVPACLSDERTLRARDLLRQAFSGDIDQISQTRFGMHRVAVDAPELQAALERLFIGRCAFCERAVPTRPYRFRPTEEAGPTSDAPEKYAGRAHLYYMWLANSWDNIYPICDTCFPLEPSIFPVRGKRCPLPERHEVELYADQPTGTWRTPVKETPLLLDPCGGEDFRQHIAVLPDGEMISLDDRGGFTIRHYKLDRDELRSSRSKALDDYFDRLVTDAPNVSAELFDFPKMTHGGSWYLLLYQLARKLGTATGKTPVLSANRIAAYFRTEFKRTGFRRRLISAFEGLTEMDVRRRAGKTKAPRPSISAPLPTEFHIRNFKSIEDLRIKLPHTLTEERRDQDRGGAIMILGENSAGKSSILEAIALALTTRNIRRDISQDATPFMLDPRYMGSEGAPRRGRIEVRFEDGDSTDLIVEPGWVDEVELDYEKPGLPLFAYGAFRLFLKGEKGRRAAAPILSLFEPDFLLPNPERWLASLYETPAFPEVVRALRSILAIDQAFDVIEPDENGEFCLSIASIAPDGSATRIRTPLTVVSSGFRSALGMACAIMRGLLDAQGSRSASLARARAIVLIDEVEAHLHPRWKMRIMTGLRESLPNVNFIVTTHDPLCLRGMQSSEVVVLRRVRRADSRPGECAELVETLQDIPAIDVLTVEQLLTSDLFQLFSTDAQDIEESLAQTGDLLALEKKGKLSEDDQSVLERLRAKLHEQVKRSMPIGSTQVERLIQEAVETYLAKRRYASAQELKSLQTSTKASILAALEQL